MVFVVVKIKKLKNFRTQIEYDFIDLGCCLNLMLKGYDKWPSKYHGVDISSKPLSYLNVFVTKDYLLVHYIVAAYTKLHLKIIILILLLVLEYLNILKKIMLNKL